MKVIYNNIIPFPGFKAINLFGVLFVRKGCTMSGSDINHEMIHTAQMKEMGMYFSTSGIWWSGWSNLQGSATAIRLTELSPLRGKPTETRRT